MYATFRVSSKNITDSLLCVLAHSFRRQLRRDGHAHAAGAAGITDSVLLVRASEIPSVLLEVFWNASAGS